MTGRRSGSSLPPGLDAEGFGTAFGLSTQTLDRTRIYAELLQRWQRTMNLVAPSTLDSLWSRHFADSAQLLALAPRETRTWVDLGSGAGFPGLVVAIMLAGRNESGARVVLVESDTRKCAFLREVARATGIAPSVSVEILNERIEKVATQDRIGSAEVVSARALASLDRLIAYAEPWLAKGATGLFLKGRGVEAELAEAEKSWHLDREVVPSVTDPDARIVVVRSIGAETEG